LVRGDAGDIFWENGMTLFKDKYRMEPARWEKWDYSWPGSYFVTICTGSRRNWFGCIADDVIELSDIGRIAEEFWMRIPDHYPFVELGDFVVMPNHVHGIIHINNVETQLIASQLVEEDVSGRGAVKGDMREVGNCGVVDAMNRVSTFGPQKNNLGGIVRSYKARVCRKVRLSCDGRFAWQSRYFDRVIRNEKELGHIQEYIAVNPLRWKYDYENPNHLEPDSNNKLAGDVYVSRSNR
jgi:REP-associated tyrosine transposase